MRDKETFVTILLRGKPTSGQIVRGGKDACRAKLISDTYLFAEGKICFDGF